MRYDVIGLGIQDVVFLPEDTSRVATPWLASPHLQTCFLNFNGLPPVFTYTRQLFRASDGGTIALDWLTNSHVLDGDLHNQKEITKQDTTPIAVVVPGLTSDSSSASDRFYNAGWTDKLCSVRI
ncbi:alpha/beta-Hydrolases superfamily protein [Raphanus sativus]|nr:alpha/beta-Hydrolases superfamily protein [Raphanus sativus]